MAQAAQFNPATKTGFSLDTPQGWMLKETSERSGDDIRDAACASLKGQRKGPV
jgi:hypothetical protein